MFVCAYIYISQYPLKLSFFINICFIYGNIPGLSISIIYSFSFGL